MIFMSLKRTYKGIEPKCLISFFTNYFQKRAVQKNHAECKRMQFTPFGSSSADAGLMVDLDF